MRLIEAGVLNIMKDGRRNRYELDLEWGEISKAGVRFSNLTPVSIHCQEARGSKTLARQIDADSGQQFSRFC
jgi:hypothetical protein